MAGSSNYARGSFTPSTDWIQIVITFSGTTANVYLNGEDISTDTNIDAITDNTEDLWIGDVTGGPQGSTNMNGHMDDIAIWNEALTAAEITALYNSGSPIDVSSNSCNYTSSSNLQGYWRMN